MPSRAALLGAVLGVLVPCGFVASSVAAQGSQKRLVAAPRGDAAVVIDGRLDEPVWAGAAIAGDFVERLPVPGDAPEVRTTVHVLFDRDALYVGVRCERTPGDALRADNLVRDSTRLWQDDAVTIKLDVRHDGRSTVGFAVNPNNAQLDFVAVDNGKVLRLEYDAVWESATAVDDDAWVAELRIPAAALGLPEVSGERVIGFDVSRDHNARVATYDWALLPPEFSPFSAQHYGELHGVRGISTGRPFSLQPYLLVGYPRADDDALPLTRKVGGDARLRLGSDSWGELTLFTDFAQADVDDQIVNLDRFPLFFPERRQFFLTGLGVFEFGRPGGVQLLFTRRIGLDAQNHAVPILTGGKVYGTAGPVDYGFLGAITDDTLSLPQDPSAEAEGQSAANYTVARMRANFAEPGHVGFLVATKQDLDLPLEREERPVPANPHVSVGVDGLLQAFDRRLVLSSFGAYTRSEDDGVTQGGAGEVRLQWKGRVLQPNLAVLRVSDDFDPEVGFVQRRGVLVSSLLVPWVNRTRALGLSDITLWSEAELTHDEDARLLLGRRLSEFLTVTWRSGYIFEIAAMHLVDVVSEPFDLFSDVEVQSGRYDGFQVQAMLQSPAVRNPSVGLHYEASDAFFSGYRHEISGSTRVAFGRHVYLKTGATFSVLTLLGCRPAPTVEEPGKRSCGEDPAYHEAVPALRRSTLGWNSTLTFTPSTKVQTDLVLQLNTQSEQAVGMLRLRYRYLPGSDLFLVYQESVSYADELVADRRVILKLAYRYDTVL